LRHNYVISRPRALQYSYRSKLISTGDEAGANPGLLTNERTPDGIAEPNALTPRAPRAREDIEKHRERLDLFIDLIWVGIISNLSEAFSYFFYEAGNNAGEATLLFILLFLPSWRIWNFLREFLNSFYQDDMLQRYFIFWVLTLSLFYGNNLAYFPGDPERVKEILITLYLCIRGSFVFMELFYSFWIPWLRRLMFFNFLVALPSSALWIAVIFVPGVNAVGPAVAAVLWEYFVPLLFDSPLRDRLMPSEYRKEVDAHHLTSRMGNFLIITIGEGVLLLIKGGPLGVGITGTAATSIWSLSIYMLLTFLYFNRDQSERYIPAVKVGGWRGLLWIS
jgi:low temperature requirement protein LtrA